MSQQVHKDFAKVDNNHCLFAVACSQACRVKKVKKVQQQDAPGVK